MLLREQVEERGEFGIAASVPGTAGVQHGEQVTGISEQVLFQLGMEESRAQPLEAAAKRPGILCVDLRSAPAKGGLAVQRCGNLDLVEGGSRALVLLRRLWQERLFVLVVGTRVEQRCVLRAQRQVQPCFNSM